MVGALKKAGGWGGAGTPFQTMIIYDAICDWPWTIRDLVDMVIKLSFIFQDFTTIWTIKIIVFYLYFIYFSIYKRRLPVLSGTVPEDW